MAHGNERPLPSDQNAEAEVIGAILKDPEAMTRVSDVLTANSFVLRRHRRIYEAAYELFSSGGVVDVVTVCSALEQSGKLALCGGRAGVAEIAGDTVVSSLLDAHIEIVADRERRRRLIRICNGTAFDTHDKPFPDVLGRHEQLILNLHSDSSGRKYGTAADGLAETAEKIAAFQDGSIHKKIVPLGFHQIDVKWKGFPGDYAVICGRPGMGKTALMLNMAERLAMNKQHPRPIGIISMEMTQEQLMSRMLHGRSGVPLWEAENKRLSSGQMDRLAATEKELAKSAIYIDDNGTQTPTSIRSRLRQWKMAHGVEAVFVDYLGLIDAPGGGLYEQITAASKSMKQIAKDVGVSMIVAAQLSRKTEMRDNKRPQLADLRDSGAIEQDTDLILGVYRPEYYARMREKVSEEDMEKTKGIAEVICLKARRGENGWTAKLQWNGPLTRFGDDLPEYIPPEPGETGEVFL